MGPISDQVLSEDSPVEGCEEALTLKCLTDEGCRLGRIGWDRAKVEGHVVREVIRVGVRTPDGQASVAGLDVIEKGVQHSNKVLLGVRRNAVFGFIKEAASCLILLALGQDPDTRKGANINQKAVVRVVVVVADEKTSLVDSEVTGFALACPPFGTSRVEMPARADYHLFQTVEVVSNVD